MRKGNNRGKIRDMHELPLPNGVPEFRDHQPTMAYGRFSIGFRSVIAG